MAQEFINWASKIGCPKENIPDENKLKTIFRTSQSNLWNNLIFKVDKAQDVKYVRQNVLIHKMQEASGDVDLTTSSTNLLPKEFQRYLKIRQLTDKIKDAEKRIELCKNEERSLLANIKQNNIKKIHVQKTLDLGNCKLNVLKAKSSDLIDRLEAESNMEHKIDTVLPVKWNASNKTGQSTDIAIKNCFQELKKFYDDFELSQHDENALRFLKANFWRKIQDTLRNIPNISLWQNLMKSLDSHIDHITKCANFEEFNKVQDNRKFLQKLLSKLHTDHICTAIKYCAGQKELDKLNNICTEQIQTIANQMEKTFEDFTYFPDNEDEDVVGQFIPVYLQKLYMQGQINYTQKKIDEIKMQNSSDKSKLNSLESLVQEISEIYTTISMNALKLQENIADFHLIKEKLNYSKVSMIYIMQDTMSCNQKFNRTLMNQSASGVSPDQTILGESNFHAVSEVILPKFLAELQIFLEIPIEKFQKKLLNLELDAKPNFLLFSSDEKLLMTLNSAHLITINGLFEVMNNKLVWNECVMKFFNDFAVDVIDSDQIAQENLKQIESVNHERILEMLDKITENNVKILAILRKSNNYYQFLLKNPLKKFVPASKTFNGRTYKEYESDYLMYFRMLKS